jgi:hypothetical protein
MEAAVAAAEATSLFSEIEKAAEIASDYVRLSVADVIADRRVELTSALGSGNTTRVLLATFELRRAAERALCGCVGQIGS